MSEGVRGSVSHLRSSMCLCLRVFVFLGVPRVCVCTRARAVGGRGGGRLCGVYICQISLCDSVRALPFFFRRQSKHISSGQLQASQTPAASSGPHPTGKAIPAFCIISFRNSIFQKQKNPNGWKNQGSDRGAHGGAFSALQDGDVAKPWETRVPALDSNPDIATSCMGDLNRSLAHMP